LSQRRTKHEDTSCRFDIEETGFTVEPAEVEIGSGYSVVCDHDDNDEPVVNVRTYGTVDIAKVQRELASLFPDAKIRHLNPGSSVVVIKKAKKKRV